MAKTKYPGVERLSAGKYRIRVKAPCPKTGDLIDVRKVISAASAREANDLRVEERQRTVAEGNGRTERTRLADYVLNSWLPMKLPEWRPSTAKQMASLLDNHVIPPLGRHFVDSIELKDLLRWRNAQTGSPASVNSRIRVLKSIFVEATYDLRLDRNPAQRLGSLPEGQKKRKDLTSGELSKLLEAAQEVVPDWYPMMLCLALTGLRWGEASALKWDDLDIEEGELRIERAHWRGHLSTTKTDTTRTVPLHTRLIRVLQDHRKAMVKDQHPGLDEGWVFPGPEGGLMTPARMREPLDLALEKSGIERRFTPHGFRHTFNNLLRRSASGEVVRSIIGHASEAMTEHYSHIDANEKRQAVERVVAVIGL